MTATGRINPTLARLRRLLVMVPWLLDHPAVPVADVAERFDATPRDVLEDLDVLGYCGLPGYGGGDLVEVMVSGGAVTVRMAPFFARPLALSMREGLALLLAAEAVRDSGLLAEADGPLGAAIAKLQDHLGGQQGGGGRVPVRMDVDAGGADLLDRLMPAVSAPRVVRITYRSASKEETTQRDVEPWAIRSVDGAWYLQGHCRLADAERSFRLDRIRTVQVTDERAPAPPPDPPRPPLYQPSPEDPVVVLDVDADVAWVADQIVLDARETRDDGRVRLSFRVASLAWAASLVGRLGGRATVITPPELRDRVVERARTTLARYEQPRPAPHPAT